MANLPYAGFLSGGWRNLPFEHFRDGVLVHWLIKGSQSEPSSAILKYQPGASVPFHRHAGLETIMVLDGNQSDENGTYQAGSLVFNAVGTEHSVWSKDGCTVLIQWNLPVIMLGKGK